MSSEKPAKWGDLGIRTASALILIPVVIACVWFGGLWFKGFVLLLTGLIAHEWASIVHPKNVAQYALHLSSALSGTVLPDMFGVEVVLLAILALALTSGFMVRFGNSASSKWSYFGIFYVGFPAIAFTLLRNDPTYGFASILWIFVIVWAADIFAYFAGRTIGGPKLAPVISPKKTWAGLVGAVAGSTLASSIFAYTFHLNGIFALAVLAGSLALMEQAGDLFESALKRFHGVKDSGALIPGHGGVIDRVDGLIAVAVVAAVFGLFRDHGISAARGLLHW
jgi:phosphatidate cytidylyltransferase